MEHDTNTRMKTNIANDTNKKFVWACSHCRSSLRTEARYSCAGFSIVEMLVVLAIGVIVTTVVVGSFSRSAGLQALDKQAAVVLSLLEQARDLTLSAKNAAVYGVHFETTKAVLFTGPTYSANASFNVVEPMHYLLQISGISLAGGGSNVVFNRLVGDTAQFGTVTLSLLASTTQSKIITIFSTGIASSN